MTRGIRTALAASTWCEKDSRTAWLVAARIQRQRRSFKSLLVHAHCPFWRWQCVPGLLACCMMRRRRSPSVTSTSSALCTSHRLGSSSRLCNRSPSSHLRGGVPQRLPPLRVSQSLEGGGEVPGGRRVEAVLPVAMPDCTASLHALTMQCAGNCGPPPLKLEREKARHVAAPQLQSRKLAMHRQSIRKRFGASGGLVGPSK